MAFSSSFLLKGTDDVNDAELARKLHENEKGLRARRQVTKKPVVSFWVESLPFSKPLKLRNMF